MAGLTYSTSTTSRPGPCPNVVSDPQTAKAAVIDPVLGFSVVSGRTDTGPAQEIVGFIRTRPLTLEWILETHAHADHLSAAQFVKDTLPLEGRTVRFESNVAEQKESNIHIRSGTRKEAFVSMREKRDATLCLPALILPAIQVNIRAGNLPQCEDNDIAYIKIPLDSL